MQSRQADSPESFVCGLSFFVLRAAQLKDDPCNAGGPWPTLGEQDGWHNGARNKKCIGAKMGHAEHSLEGRGKIRLLAADREPANVPVFARMRFLQKGGHAIDDIACLLE